MYYKISRNGNSLGEYTEEQLNLHIANGSILLTDYAWKQGMANWVKVAELGITPPPPPAPGYSTPASNRIFKNPFSFNGRIRRSEYAISWIILHVLTIIILVIASTFPLFGFALIASVWFGLAQATKRCHDLGLMGIAMIIPFFILWLFFAEGNLGPNKYGPDPKNRQKL
jgi:uncharacterized membrane protein YhaH (DUF805 family)